MLGRLLLVLFLTNLNLFALAETGTYEPLSNLGRNVGQGEVGKDYSVSCKKNGPGK